MGAALAAALAATVPAPEQPGAWVRVGVWRAGVERAQARQRRAQVIELGRNDPAHAAQVESFER